MHRAAGDILDNVMRSLGELLADQKVKTLNVDKGVLVRGITHDSRSVKDGFIFAALKGCKGDRALYASEALRNGAVAILAEACPRSLTSAPFLLAEDPRKTLAVAASRFYGSPSRSLDIIGITGTNGKTTSSYMIRHILNQSGLKASLIGSVEYVTGGVSERAGMTTPDAVKLHSLLSSAKEAGEKYVVLEVSSHALKQSRVWGVDFKTAVLTNITGDHLDYHRTMKDYADSKQMLFKRLSKGSVACLNADDKSYKSFRSSTVAQVLTYGFNGNLDIKANRVKEDINGSEILLDTPKGPMRFHLALVGLHNVYNAMAACAVSMREGIDIDSIRNALEGFSGAPGRMEAVDCGQNFSIFIDYAHTHDALYQLLKTVRNVTKGDIALVFGCGGDRDRLKRPLMAKVASELADMIILTNDNPRSEDPDAIMADIEKGFTPAVKSYRRIDDRSQAIRFALSGRKKGDAVVIAGKGHEEYQIIGNRVIPFSDREAVIDIMGSVVSEAK